MKRNIGRNIAAAYERICNGFGTSIGFSFLKILLVAVAAGFFAAEEALGRPGGGQSYSGRSSGGGGYGGGGGGGDAALIYFAVRLLFAYPKIGVPVLIVGVIWFSFTRRQKSHKDWSTGDFARHGYPVPAPYRGQTARAQLESLKKLDPDFSLVLFDDFAFALYAAVHEARGSGKLETFAAYLAPEAREALLRQSVDVSQVKTVVIGSMKYVQASGLSEHSRLVHVRLEFEANYTEVSRDGSREQTYYVVEQWELARKPTAKSRPPDQVRNFGCPSCGAPLDSLRGNTCSFCGNVVDTGEFDWVVKGSSLKAREPRAPQLTSDVAEQGTHLPTIVDPSARRRLQQLMSRDPAFDWDAFAQRIQYIFDVLQKAWSSREWTSSRPYVSDNLFQMLLYWIETYKRSGLRNVTEASSIQGIELAQVTRDKYFDAITVRVIATGLDYTVTNNGKVVSGSRSRPRSYSEYWTLIRGSGTRGESRSDASCPSCGASVKVSMTGSCEYCAAKLTSGEFDWVLSRIEQDEAYQG